MSCSSRRRRKQAISIVRCGSLMRASAAALRDIIRRAKCLRPASGRSESTSRSAPNSFRKPTFSIWASRLVGPLPGGTEPSHSRRLIPPSSIGANRRGNHVSRSGPARPTMALNRVLLLVPPRGRHETADVALAQQQIIVIDQPRARARHQLGIVEHRGGFAPQIGNEAALGMLARLRAAERGEGGRLMVEQACAAAGRAPGSRQSAAGRIRAGGRDVPAPRSG